MLVLAIETSGFGGSIAVLDDDHVLGETILDAQRRHAQTLVPEIYSLLSQHGRQANECELIAVSTGPGSFTGLRVGITCVKTLSYATGCQIAAVPTFPSIAAGSPDDIDRLHVVMNAQRQELFVGRFARQADGNWLETQPLSIERSTEWQASLTAADTVTGPGLEGISDAVASRCRVLPAEFWQPQARWVGRLGLQAANQGRTTSCWDLLPLYVRKSAAEEKWDANHPTESA